MIPMDYKDQYTGKLTPQSQGGALYTASSLALVVTVNMV